jgi:hypothetical protein
MKATPNRTCGDGDRRFDQATEDRSAATSAFRRSLTHQTSQHHAEYRDVVPGLGFLNGKQPAVRRMFQSCTRSFFRSWTRTGFEADNAGFAPTRADMSFRLACCRTHGCRLPADAAHRLRCSTPSAAGPAGHRCPHRHVDLGLAGFVGDERDELPSESCPSRRMTVRRARRRRTAAGRRDILQADLVPHRQDEAGTVVRRSSP